MTQKGIANQNCCIITVKKYTSKPVRMAEWSKAPDSSSRNILVVKMLFKKCILGFTKEFC